MAQSQFHQNGYTWAVKKKEGKTHHFTSVQGLQLFEAYVTLLEGGDYLTHIEPVLPVTLF